jgi:hypothetical protein
MIFEFGERWRRGGFGLGGWVGRELRGVVRLRRGAREKFLSEN